MPSALNIGYDWDRPSKRRRSTSPLSMARINHEEDVRTSKIRPVSPHSSSGSDSGKSDPRSEIRTSDREELIQCIKRGERPTWVPKPGLEALCAEVNAETALALPRTEGTAFSFDIPDKDSPSMQPSKRTVISPIQMSRTPSAFHTGDFRHEPRSENPSNFSEKHATRLNIHTSNLYNSSSPTWLSSSPYPTLNRTSSDFSAAHNNSTQSIQRTRAPSLGSSLSSSFVLRVPTSPLVHSTNNSSLDLSSEEPSTDYRLEAERHSRRRTMPPNAFAGVNISSPDFGLFSSGRSVHASRRESGLPYQSHHSRRSLSSFTYQSGTSPQTPFPARVRRLSNAPELSPRQRTSMVGSFEESILRGRMSTTPSKPLDFVAQIGVVGRGDCPSSLKCPAHVSVPFPAVFYNYPSVNGPRTISDDSPSPYVGTIDLESNLKPYVEPSKRKRQPEISDPELFISKITGPENTPIGKALARDAEAKEKKKRASKAPPGGAYRVPQQGQLQVIIKNPNKTAVKLFLVPYDLEGMQPGTKTFVRQRSCSTGTIMETPLSDNPNGSTVLDPLSSKQILRYLIHVKFCCPAKDRYFLYDNIQVIFANRVPESKEKLSNEIQLPQPRFSPYKAGLRSSRRQSVSDSEVHRSPVEGQVSPFNLTANSTSEYRTQKEPLLFPSTPIPFHLASRPASNGGLNELIDLPKDARGEIPEDIGSVSVSSSDRPQSPVAGFELPSTSARGSPIPWNPSLSSSGPRSFSPIPAEAGNGLLSRKLREFNKQGAQTHYNGHHADSK